MTNEERQALKETVDREQRRRTTGGKCCSGCGGDYLNATVGCRQCSDRKAVRRRREFPDLLLRLPGGDDARPSTNGKRDVPVLSPPESPIRVQPKDELKGFGYCIYCSRRCYGRACSHHRDLVQIEARGA